MDSGAATRTVKYQVGVDGKSTVIRAQGIVKAWPFPYLTRGSNQKFGQGGWHRGNILTRPFSGRVFLFSTGVKSCTIQLCKRQKS